MARTYDLRRNITGTVNVTNGNECVTATVTNVASTTTEVLFAAQDINRCGLLIHNDSNKTLFIKYGAGVTSTNYTIKLKGGDQTIIDDYRGNVYGVWDQVNGFAMITINGL